MGTPYSKPSPSPSNPLTSADLPRSNPPPNPNNHSNSLANYRTFLTALVILHHASISYGGLGSWPYKSPFHTEASSPSLVVFNALNQSFFMGSFFYISGFLSRKSLGKKREIEGKRKGNGEGVGKGKEEGKTKEKREKGRGRANWEFVIGKITRLGIPAAVYTIFGPPLQILIMDSFRGGNLMSNSLAVFTNHWKTIRGPRGPVWYPAVLLTFDTLFAFVPPSLGTLTTGKIKLPSLGFWGLLGLDIGVNFFVRVWWPLGTAFKPLGVQVGYLTQYVFAYSLGVYAATPAPTPTSTSTTTSPSEEKSPPTASPPPPAATAQGINFLTLSPQQKSLLLAASLLSSASILTLLSTPPSPDLLQSLTPMMGGLNTLALSYAVWNETTGILLGSSLLEIFQGSRWLGGKWDVGGWGIGKWSYASFLVHGVCLVVVQSAFERWSVVGNGRGNGVLMTGVVGGLAVVGSWVSGVMLEKLLGGLRMGGIIA